MTLHPHESKSKTSEPDGPFVFTASEYYSGQIQCHTRERLSAKILPYSSLCEQSSDEKAVYVKSFLRQSYLKLTQLYRVTDQRSFC